MEDFFAVIFEEIMDTVLKPFNSVKRVGLRTFLEIVVCIVGSIVFIGIGFFVSFVIEFVKTQYGIVISNPVVRAIVAVLVIAVCLVLFFGIVCLFRFLLRRKHDES